MNKITKVLMDRLLCGHSFSIQLDKCLKEYDWVVLVRQVALCKKLPYDLPKWLLYFAFPSAI